MCLLPEEGPRPNRFIVVGAGKGLFRPRLHVSSLDNKAIYHAKNSE